MDHLRQHIADLVEHKPKHFAQIIRRNPQLLDEIQASHEDNISEKVYLYLHGVSNKCNRGNVRKFKSIHHGYGYCGTASVCACAKQSVSQKVSEAKAQYTQEDQHRINQKRLQTNQSRYGVSNTGQLESARQRHRDLYQDPHRVQEITDRIRNTKFRRHGSATYNNAEQIKSTWDTRKKQLFQERFPEKDLETLYDHASLELLFHDNTVEQLSQKLNVSSSTVLRYLNEYGLRKKFTSSLEDEMVMFLQQNHIHNIVRNSRKILGNGKEVDIYLPDHQVAIEMNGIYWHHDQVKTITKHSHINKWRAASDNDIQLVGIFSDEWETRKSIFKRAVLHKLGIAAESCYARKTQIASVDAPTARSFLDQHHVQGATGSTWRYGLYDHGELVAVMTFSKPRAGINGHWSDREGTAELVRYATSKRVVGGASRLLKYFIDHSGYNRVISYSNNQYSTGNLYQALGFTKANNPSLGYFYYDPETNRRFNRYTFAKHKLVEQGYDPELSEYEIMCSRGFWRVWDYGQTRWVYDA